MATRMKAEKRKQRVLTIPELRACGQSLGEQNMSFAAAVIQSQSMDLDEVNVLIDKIQTLLEAENSDHNFAIATLVGLTGKLLLEWDPKPAMIALVN